MVGPSTNCIPSMARRQHAGGHFHTHAHGLKPRPQPAFRRHAAIGAAHCAHALVGKGQRHGAQIIGRHAHIAVADDENLVRASASIRSIEATLALM
jgi:hypothetical protein